MKHDNKGAHRPAMHDAPDSITPITTPSSAPDSTMQEAEALLELIENYMRRFRPSREVAMIISQSDAVIRALVARVKRYGLCGLEEKPHELKPDACVGWISYQEVEQMQARIESLEAERELLDEMNEGVGLREPIPSEIVQRVEDKRRATK